MSITFSSINETWKTQTNQYMLYIPGYKHGNHTHVFDVINLEQG